MTHSVVPDQDILCVVSGMPHSGTTYLSKLLTSNPDIMTGFECGILLDDLNRFPKLHPWYEWMQGSADGGNWGVAPEHMEEICSADNYISAYSLVKKYAGEIGSPKIKRCFSEAKYLIDKTPRYIYELDRVMRLVDLPFIVIKKDIHGQYRSFKKRGESFSRFAVYYLTAAHSLKMARSKFEDRLLVVLHRELVEDRDEVLKAIYAFLGQPYYPHSSLVGFFQKTGFDPGEVNRRTVGLRSRLQPQSDTVQLSGWESKLLKATLFMEQRLPGLVALPAKAMRLVLAAKRRLRA